MVQDPITVALSVEPNDLPIRDRESVVVTLTATNHGRRTVDPRLREARLLVNGRESKAWQLAVGNGRRPASWAALPSGESISMSWSSLGPSLFPEPGDYQLTLSLRDQRLSPVEIRVRPD